MSYVPYTPDVCPPIDAFPPKSRRFLFWFLGTFLYLSLVAGWVWWMKQPPKIQPPLARIALNDGTEIRLVNVREGVGHSVYPNETFNDRIRVKYPAFYYGNSNSRTGRGTWMVFTQFDPSSEEFGMPHITSFEISEPGSPAIYQGLVDSSSDRGFVHETILFPVVPRRSPTLKLRIKSSGTTREFDAVIPNPVYQPNAPTWKGESLPQEKVVDGVTVSVNKISFGTSRISSDQGTTEVTSAFPSIQVSQPGVPKGAFSNAYEWSDATGNVIEKGTLPFSEAVWKLTVTVKQNADYPFPPNQVYSLGKIPVPTPGQVSVLKVPTVLLKYGVTDALVIGPGTYHRNGNSITRVGANGQPPKLVATTTGYSPGSIGNISSWEIHLISRGSGGIRNKGLLLRMNHASGKIDSSSTGSNSNGYASTDTWGIFRTKDGPVPAGDLIEIEMVVPKPMSVEFFINRPEAPK